MRRNLFRTPQYAIRFLCCVLFFFLGSCTPAATPTPFIAPRSQKNTPTGISSVAPVTTSPQAALDPLASATASPALENPATTHAALPFPTIAPPEATLPVPTIEPASPTPQEQNCADSMKYVEDINYPDGTIVSPGQAIEKQWLVENNGSCDWDGRYRLKLIDGYTDLGAPSELALYPARAGTQITISISFIAPADPGSYRTAWQAYNPDGTAFGDPIYMEIIIN